MFIVIDKVLFLDNVKQKYTKQKYKHIIFGQAENTTYLSITTMLARKNEKYILYIN